VISILIALQINAWNQARMEGNKQISYLKNLNVELEEQVLILNEFIDFESSSVDYAKRINFIIQSILHLFQLIVS